MTKRIRDRAGTLADVGGGRAARGLSEALGGMDPVDFDVAYFKWPLWRLLVYTSLRNIHIKDEELEMEKSKAMAGISSNGFM